MGGERLSRVLLRLFAEGELPGTTVWEIAAAAYEDGWGHDSEVARWLVSSGSAGKRRSKIADDLVKVAEKTGWVCSQAKPYSLPLSHGGSALVYLPHECFHGWVQETRLEDWTLSAGQLAENKTIAALLREWSEHPDVEFGGNLGEVGIIGVHMDGVQYTSSMRAGGARSIMAGSMNVLSAQSAELRYKRQPLFTIAKANMCKCGCGGYHSLQDITAVLAWSFQALAQGVAPDCRHDGSDFTQDDLQSRLPAGQHIHRAALLQVRGDWEGMEQEFRVRAPRQEHFCWMCDAAKDGGGCVLSACVAVLRRPFGNALLPKPFVLLLPAKICDGPAQGAGF
jgi:hypothetical protein